MSVDLVNYDLIHEVLQSIRNNPEKHDQDSWVAVKGQDIEDAQGFIVNHVRIGLDDFFVATGSCNTTACIAGWALLHSEYVAADANILGTTGRYDALRDADGNSYYYSEVGELAARRLGIENERYEQLFMDFINKRAIAQLMFLYEKGRLPDPTVTELNEETGEGEDADLSKWDAEEIMDADHLLLEGMHDEEFAREWYARFEAAFAPEKTAAEEFLKETENV